MLVASATHDDLSADDPQFFDCNVVLGRSSGGRQQRAHELRPDDLIREMDRLRITEAMVYHVLGREYAPSVGNDRILEATRDYERLHPVWIVMPEHTGELAPPRELIRQMRDHGVRLAQAFPSSDTTSHRFSLKEWCSGALLNALEEASMPLAIDFRIFRRGEPPWDDLHSVAVNHPYLKLLIVGVQGRNNRTLYALLDRFPGLYIQTLGLNVHAGLEDVVRRFGADRLVYGSTYPANSMGAARFHLDRAALTTEQKRSIAGGNLRSLLNLT
jgi:predicted TIM-barrel fold metal-dependent hydrolase